MREDGNRGRDKGWLEKIMMKIMGKVKLNGKKPDCCSHHHAVQVNSVHAHFIFHKK
jgi:hypothetical protein